MSRASFSCSRQTASLWKRPQFIQAYEFIGFSGVHEIGGRNKNIIAFTDQGEPQASTFQLRPGFQQKDFPIIHTEEDRMGRGIEWANCKYHAFWGITETQEFFALFKYDNVEFRRSSYTIPGDSKPTHRASFDIAKNEIILLFDGRDFCLAQWDGSELVEDRPFLMVAIGA